MVDISSSSSAAKGKGNHAAPSDNSMRTKIILIVTLSVVAVAAIGVTVFALLNNKTEPQTTQPVASKEFTFAEKTLVSGVDITGGKDYALKARNGLMVQSSGDDTTVMISAGESA